MIGRACAFAVVLWGLLACGDDTASAVEQARALRRDAEDLQRALLDDPAAGPLEDVDQAIDEDKPVRAAELLDGAAVPAARLHVRRLRDMAPRTHEGRRLRDRLVRAYDERLRGLEQQRDALAGGERDSHEHVRALTTQREAVQEIDAVMGELEHLVSPAGAPGPGGR